MTERFIFRRRGVVTPPYERCKAGHRGESELAQRAKRGWSGPRRPLRKRGFRLPKTRGSPAQPRRAAPEVLVMVIEILWEGQENCPFVLHFTFNPVTIFENFINIFATVGE